MLPGRIEQSFLNRVAELPEPTRRLLLVAAAEPEGDLDLVRLAAERLGVTLAAALTGGTDGLLTIDVRVTFRHPLVRSAVYQSARPEDRRAAHLALAEVTDPVQAPDRRAWHLASAAAGPDEAVATQLELAAGRAQARGGIAAAAAFLQRSVALTADPGKRADRMLAAAEASLRVGEFDDVRRLLDLLRSPSLDGLQRGRAGMLEGQASFLTGGGSAAIGLLLTAAGQLEPADPQLARESYLHAWNMANIIADRDAILAVSRAVRNLPAPVARRPMDMLLDGVALLVTEGRAAAAAILTEVSSVITDIPVTDVLRWGLLSTAAPVAIWDLDTMLEVSARQVRVVRDAGALQRLPESLINLGYALSWAGDFAGAAAAIEEGDIVAGVTGSPLPPYITLRLLALRGQEPECPKLISTTMQDATGYGSGTIAAGWAGAVLCNGLARYPEAMRFVRAAEEKWDPWHAVWLLPELIEAATRTGELAVARAALDQLVEATGPYSADYPAGLEARNRALLADEQGADDLYREAVERLSRTPMRPDLARAHLLYGEWLRRRGQRVQAREHLRAAYKMFVSIGMEAFAERARRELLATGETVRRRVVEASKDGELTPQERQIAQLVRDGLSNPEVGARLFLSPRTVEWHLRKIFAKLSITSRRQLREVLPSQGAPQQ
jgi:DNA-binding CsgD family transcriptional regulator